MFSLTSGEVLITLKNLSDSALNLKTKDLVLRERELLTEVLHHLREIERRRLYSSLSYRSLHEYAVKELGYADDAAYRRIDAMRLMKELPQLEEKIVDGTLNLSTINAATKIFRAEAKASGARVEAERKIEMLSVIENKSKSQAEMALQKITTAPKEFLKPEKIRETEDYVEFQFYAKKTCKRSKTCSAISFLT